MYATISAENKQDKGHVVISLSYSSAGCSTTRMRHLSQLMHIHPGQQGTLAIAGDVIAEQGMLSNCQYKGPAGGQEAFTLAGIFINHYKADADLQILILQDVLNLK